MSGSQDRVEGLDPYVALQRAQIWLRDTNNREKRSHYGRLLGIRSADANAQTERIPANVAEVAYKLFVLEDDEAHAFAHPFFWAAFCYVGV
jgi:CHAT domain-containing protein